LGLFVLLRNPRKIENILFFLFTISIFVWNIGYALMYSAGDASSALNYAKIGTFGIIYIPFLANLLVLEVLKRKEAVFNWVLFICALILVGILMNNGFYTGMRVNAWGNYPIANTFDFLNIIFYVALFLKFNIQLLSAIRNNSNEDKDKYKYLLAAFGIGLFGFIDWIPNYTSFYPLAFLLSSSWVIIIAYAITKKRLMDISVVISRALAELLTFSFFGAIYLAIVWVYRTYVSTQIDLPFILINMLCGTLVGRMHHEVRLFIQTSSDKLFIRGRYDYYKELSDASNKVGKTLSLHDILKVLYGTFHDVVEISNPKVYLPDNFSNVENSSNDYVAYSKETFEPEAGGQAIPNESQLVKDLIAKREPQFEVKEAKAALVIPCMLENRLIAMFVLGKKLSEDPYTDEDVRLLTVLANQVAVALDHTRSYEKIKADLESAEKELERSQRLASIGTLVAGVTHEIRNPMTVIRGRVETLFNAERDEAYKKDAQRAILENADRIERIIQAMLGLARDKTHRTAVDINLNEVLERTIEFFPFNGTKLHKELGAVPTFKGDVDSLREVFVNLMQNAIEAMAHGGSLTLRTYTEEGHAVVEIADTGKGIPVEIREKIFDPFFSSRHEGVGLGLSIAYRIVREHGGDMKFVSEVGKGTTFKITF